jgi:hypothetical protein
MRAIKNIDNLTTVESLDQFLQGKQVIALGVLGDKTERYQFTQKILVKFTYQTCSKKDKGLISRFLMKMTGYSRQQVTRLIGQHKRKGRIEWQPCRDNGFSRRYSNEDVRLLALMDEQHEMPCGQAIKKLCERADQLFGEIEYRNLSLISVSHLYNLRGSLGYKKHRQVFTKTQSRKVNIGERRKPAPNGQPGYIRIGSVHQGDLDKQKGVYHINAVDEVTQFEMVVSVEKISEAYLIPILAQMLDGFPFVIEGFHVDNGSEYVNRNVAALLQKLLIELTKFRSRQTNANALAEAKNAAIVGKQFGCHHIPQKWAPQMNEFNVGYLCPHINYHRLCFFPEIKIDAKGKQRKIYPYKNMMTPYDKLKSLPEVVQYLKPGITLEILDELAMRVSDNESAIQLRTERNKLFNLIFEKDRKQA